MESILTILVPLTSYYLMRPKKANQTTNSANTKPSQLSRLPWYNLGLLGIFLLSAVLRFKDLGRFNKLVFDEVHFVNFANKYLNQTELFDAHPPLAKYMIALGIWIGNTLNLGEDIKNDLTGNLISTVSYRWMNAFVGSLIPVMMAALARRLSQRRAFALITGYFAALDGLFIIESRYALLEVYIVFFGLFAQLSLLNALQISQSYKHLFWLVLAGIGFGATAAAKWSGLGFWGPIIALWVANEILKKLGFVGRFALRSTRAARDFVLNLGIGASISIKFENGKAQFTAVIEKLNSSESSQTQQLPSSPTTESTCSEGNSISLEETENLSVTTFKPFTKESPLANLGRLNVYQLITYLGLIPAIFYVLHWIPHLELNPSFGFFEQHRQMFNFHNNLAADGHAYCSRWYTWPLMLRPMCFYFEKTEEYKEDIHSIGNPFLWWFSTIAITAMLFIFIRETFRWVFRIRQDTTKDEILPSVKPWISLYLFLNYAANFLPYTLINRCAFIYHYMPASIYAEIALAWLVDNWLRSQRTNLRLAAATVLFVVSASFVFFAPIFYGTPLDEIAYDGRMLFDSWI